MAGKRAGRRQPGPFHPEPERAGKDRRGEGGEGDEGQFLRKLIFVGAGGGRSFKQREGRGCGTGLGRRRRRFAGGVRDGSDVATATAWEGILRSGAHVARAHFLPSVVVAALPARRLVASLQRELLAASSLSIDVLVTPLPPNTPIFSDIGASLAPAVPPSRKC